MSVAGFTSRGLLRMRCGEPFTLSRARPNAIRVEDLFDPFHATCLLNATNRPLTGNSIYKSWCRSTAPNLAHSQSEERSPFCFMVSDTSPSELR